MCKCGHTPEKHEVSGRNDFPSLILNRMEPFGTLYTSYCKEPECNCEAYRLAETIPVGGKQQ